MNVNCPECSEPLANVGEKIVCQKCGKRAALYLPNNGLFMVIWLNTEVQLDLYHKHECFKMLDP